MNLDKIAKLYGALTNKEKAALVFAHLVDGDDLETQKILSSVPRKTYKCVDAEYQAFHNAIWDISVACRAEYWYQKSRSLACLGSYGISIVQNKNNEADKIYDDFVSVVCTLFALSAALDIVCQNYKISSAAIRKFVGMDLNDIEDYKLLSDPEKEAEYVELFSRRLSQLH